MMGECGCGEMILRRAWPLAGTETVVGLEVYLGCDGCNTPAAVTLRLFTPEGWRQWSAALFGELEAPIAPDDYGGNEGYGWTIPIAGVDDLQAVAEQDEEMRDIDPAEYATLADLMAQFGLPLLQGAILRREKQAMTRGPRAR